MDPAASPVAPAEAAVANDGRPGLRTSEFGITVAVLVLGAYLILTDRHPDLGADLVTWATGGYVAARAVAKGGISSALAAIRGR